LGGWGRVVAILLLMLSQSRFGNAGCARPVMPVLVVLAWFERSWCGLPGMLSLIVCWA
jgi:hypothetical protein